MKITLIGGSGFIGTNLINLLKNKDENNYEIANIDKRQSAMHPDITVVGDIRDKGELELKMKYSDWVILLAAEHQDNVSPFSLYYDVNVKGTSNVLKLLEEKGIQQIIFTSSVAIYGLNKPSPDEDYPADPFNHYGKSKWQAEEILRDWYDADPHNRTLIILRPTVVFGSGNRGNVYNLLKQLAEGKFLMVGNGRNKKSMAYVENIAGFIKHCVDSNMKGYHVFNYADKPDLDMNNLLHVAEESLDKKLTAIRIPYFLGYLGGLAFDTLSWITGKKFPISSIRVKKFCATTEYNNEALIQSGYVAPFSLTEGLTKTIGSIVAEENAK